MSILAPLPPSAPKTLPKLEAERPHCLWCGGRAGCCAVGANMDAGCDAVGAGWGPAPGAAVWECPPISAERFGIYGPK